MTSKQLKKNLPRKVSGYGVILDSGMVTGPHLYTEREALEMVLVAAKIGKMAQVCRITITPIKRIRRWKTPNYN